MQLEASTVGSVLIVALVISIASLVVAGVALNGQRRVRAAYRTFSQGSRDDVLTLLQRHIEEVRGLRADVADERRYADQLRDLIGRTICRVSTIRYDAFEDMGGRLSFSTALLDEHGTGVVISSINGRTETRSYAKPVVEGRSRHNLSKEEAQAIDEALANERPSAPVEVVRRVAAKAAPRRAPVGRGR